MDTNNADASSSILTSRIGVEVRGQRPSNRDEPTGSRRVARDPRARAIVVLHRTIGMRFTDPTFVFAYSAVRHASVYRRVCSGTRVAQACDMLKLIGSYALAKLLGFGIGGAIVIYLLLSLLT